MLPGHSCTDRYGPLSRTKTHISIHLSLSLQSFALGWQSKRDIKEWWLSSSHSFVSRFCPCSFIILPLSTWLTSLHVFSRFICGFVCFGLLTSFLSCFVCSYLDFLVTFFYFLCSLGLFNCFPPLLLFSPPLTFVYCHLTIMWTFTFKDEVLFIIQDRCFFKSTTFKNSCLCESVKWVYIHLYSGQHFQLLLLACRRVKWIKTPRRFIIGPRV